MLTPPYQAALQALKDQAHAATFQIVNADREAKKQELKDAQGRMAKYPVECKKIVWILMHSDDPDLTIETLDEERLAAELGTK